MSEVKCGFEPLFNSDSKLLILGSFPSVKSRKVEFYYGNPQNRFWRVVSSFFGESVPQSIQDKKKFLLSHNIALWDIVTECEISGSQDSTIKNFKVADLKTLLQNCDISYIILNGATAYKIFEDNYGHIEIPYIKLPSTSPANTRFSEKEWFNALSTAFDRT